MAPSCEATLLLYLTCLLQLPSSAISQCVSPPTITEPSQTDVIFDEGDMFTLKCAADGIPKPSYTWRKKVNFQESSYTLLASNARNLTINSTNGLYQCWATNQCGTVLQQFRVTIPQLNQFEPRNIITVITDEGSRVILDCQPPEGTPVPYLYWSVVSSDGSNPIPVRTSERVNTDNRTGNLVFANVLQSDSEYYRCNARNSGRDFKVSKNTRLVINTLDNSLIKNHGPNMTVFPPAHVEGMKGRPLRLECMATGRPTPNVTWTRWTRDGESIGSNLRTASFGLALVIDELDFSDSGIYKCKAVSDGREDYRITNVTVKSAPYWTTKPNDIRIAPGDSASIPCIAYGDPLPDTRWLANGEELNNADITSRVRVEGNSVVVTNARIEDTMVLQCVSRNIYGEIFTNVVLNTLPIPTDEVTSPLPVTDALLTSSDSTVESATSTEAPTPTEGTTEMEGTTASTENFQTTPISSSTTTPQSTTTEASQTTSFSSTTPPPTTTVVVTSDQTKLSSAHSTIPSGTTTQMGVSSPIPSSSTKTPSTTKGTTTQMGAESSVSSSSTKIPSTIQGKATTGPVKDKQTNEESSSLVLYIIIPVVAVAILIIVLVILVYFLISKKGKSGSFSPGLMNSIEVTPGEGKDTGNVDLTDNSSIDVIVVNTSENGPSTATFKQDDEKTTETDNSTPVKATATEDQTNSVDSTDEGQDAKETTETAAISGSDSNTDAATKTTTSPKLAENPTELEPGAEPVSRSEHQEETESGTDTRL